MAPTLGPACTSFGPAAGSLPRRTVFKGERKPPKVSLKAVSEEQLYAYLARPATQDRVARLVSAFVARGTPENVKDDIIQEANVVAMRAQSRPRSTRSMPAWLRTVVRRATCQYFRSGAADHKWLNRDEDVEEVGAAPVGPPDCKWLIADWLESAVANDERDQETFELVGDKARTGKTDEQVANEQGMTYSAWVSRLSRFRQKYEPRWRKRQQLFILLTAGGAVALAVGLYLLWKVFAASFAPVAPVRVPVPLPVSAAPVPAPVPEPFKPAGSTKVPDPEPWRRVDPTREKPSRP